jgi:hypothetical protein
MILLSACSSHSSDNSLTFTSENWYGLEGDMEIPKCHHLLHPQDSFACSQYRLLCCNLIFKFIFVFSTATNHQYSWTNFKTTFYKINLAIMCQFSGFCSGIVEVSVLMECDTALLGNCYPTFWEHHIVPNYWEPIIPWCSVTSLKNADPYIHCVTPHPS